MKIRAYRDDDWLDWLRMSLTLFPHHSAEELAPGMQEFRGRADADVFVVERADGSVAGFVEVGARPYADGCDTSPVGYVEAWYVDPDVRGGDPAGVDTGAVLGASPVFRAVALTVLELV